MEKALNASVQDGEIALLKDAVGLVLLLALIASAELLSFIAAA